MTWTYKHTRSDRPIVAEYLCPVHGRFELTVERDANGDPPASSECPVRPSRVVPRWVGSDEPCGAASPYAISAPGAARVKAFEVVRGGWEKPERPTYFDTRKLGEGQPLEEFRAERAKVWEERRWAENKELLK
jgi:hypothetical protein